MYGSMEIGVIILLMTATMVVQDRGVLEDINRERSRLTANGITHTEYLKGNTGQGFLNITGTITKFGDTKVITISCVQTPKYRTRLDYVYYFYLGWYKEKDETKKLMAGIYYRDHLKKGQNNIRWPDRERWKDMPVYQSALDMHDSQSHSNGNKNKDFIRIFLPLNVCDPVTGVFECETMSKSGPDWRLWQASDQFSFENDEDAKLDPNCEKNPKLTANERKAIKTFSQKKGQDTLSSIYRVEVRKFRLSAKRNIVKLDGKVDKFNTKKSPKMLELKCRIPQKYLNTYKRVHRFYIFWQPDPYVSPVHFLLAGLIRDKPMWVENYNIRNFPHVQRALEQKFWEGNLGSSRAAWFRITLPVDQCDTLKGRFWCEAFTEITKVRKEVIAGYYNIPENSILAKPDKKCFQKEDEVKDIEAEQRRLAKLSQKSEQSEQFDTRSGSRSKSNKAPHDLLPGETKGFSKEKSPVNKNIDPSGTVKNNKEKSSDSMGLYVGGAAVVVIVVMAGGIACYLANKKTTEENDYTDNQALLDDSQEDQYEQPPQQRPREARGRGRGRGRHRGQGRGRGQSRQERSVNNSSVVGSRSSFDDERGNYGKPKFPVISSQDRYDVYPQKPDFPSRRLQSKLDSTGRQIDNQGSTNFGDRNRYLANQQNQGNFTAPLHQIPNLVGLKTASYNRHPVPEPSAIQNHISSPAPRNQIYIQDQMPTKWQQHKDYPDEDAASQMLVHDRDQGNLTKVLSNRRKSLASSTMMFMNTGNDQINVVGQNTPGISPLAPHRPRMPSPANNIPPANTPSQNQFVPPAPHVVGAPPNRAALLQSIRLKRVSSVSAPNLPS